LKKAFTPLPYTRINTKLNLQLNYIWNELELQTRFDGAAEKKI
jgi:hypothetical protein